MPGGSILGPFLSLNYIGDSHVWLNYSEERYFAFDTNLNFINKQVNYDLLWKLVKEQIQDVTIKLNMLANAMLSKLQHALDIKPLRSVYYAIFESH